jgi:radical SAM superfamily enzyme YgiQ (UPF0313 family)
MGLKIALFVPPSTYADWYKFPVLGLSYLKAVIKSNGHDTKIFDARFHGFNKKQLVDKIVEYGPNVIGLSAMTHDIVPGVDIIKKLKMELDDATIVVGGCHVTALPKRTLKEFPLFDYGICGEAEETFVELLDCLNNSNRESLKEIAGLVHQINGRIFVNSARETLSINKMNSLPYPDFDDYFVKGTNALGGRGDQYPMITSRGCPFKCIFCMRVLGGKIRRRSPESICDEIQFAIDNYSAHTIRIRDEIFLTNSSVSIKTLEMMISRGISEKIKWSAQTRVNFVSEKLMTLAKKAGCFKLALGVESGDDSILKQSNRGYTVDDVRRAVNIIKAANIRLDTTYIIGHPNETFETAKRTTNLAVELNTDTVAIGLMVPYPGTGVYAMAKNRDCGYRLLSENWEDYDKYGSRCLELEGLSHVQMQKLQKLAMIRFYLYNMRIKDMMSFAWKKKRGIVLLLKHNS